MTLSSQHRHLLGGCYHFHCLRDKKTSPKRLKNGQNCRQWCGKQESWGEFSASHPGLVLSFWSLISLAVWLPFSGYLFSTMSFRAGGALGLAPGSPRALCCPRYLPVQSQPGCTVRPPTLGDALAPSEGCLLQELPTGQTEEAVKFPWGVLGSEPEKPPDPHVGEWGCLVLGKQRPWVQSEPPLQLGFGAVNVI